MPPQAQPQYNQKKSSDIKKFFTPKWSIVGFIIGILFLILGFSDYGDPEMFQMIFLSLPWSILFLILSIFIGDSILAILFGIGVIINAFIIYRIGQFFEESIKNKVLKFVLILILLLILSIFLFAFVNDFILR